MILELRQRHRRMFLTLGIVLPVVFVVGLAARKPVPAVNNLPPEFQATLPNIPPGDWEFTDIFPKVPVYVHLLREKTSDGHSAIVFTAERNFAKPDLLAYWVPGVPKISDKLPNEALLLGAFGSVALPLPERAATSEGVLVLYSLANNEIVDVSRAIDFSKLAK